MTAEMAEAERRERDRVRVRRAEEKEAAVGGVEVVLSSAGIEMARREGRAGMKGFTAGSLEGEEGEASARVSTSGVEREEGRRRGRGAKEIGSVCPCEDDLRLLVVESGLLPLRSASASAIEVGTP